MYGNYEELEVWRLAHQLVKRVYKITSNFPPEEKFGLISQLRRAAASVPTNISEGSLRLKKGDFRQFVSIARGSCGEVQYLLMLSNDIKYLENGEHDELREMCIRINKMLTKLYQSLS